MRHSRYTRGQLKAWLSVHGTIRGGSNRTLELQQQRVAALDQAKAIVTGAQARPEGQRGLTTDETTRLSGFTAQVKTIDSTISAEAELATLSNIPTDVQLRGSGAQVKDLMLDKPFGPEKRANESKREREMRLAIGFGEQLIAIKDAEFATRRGQAVDPRLLQLNEMNKRGYPGPAGASEQVPADGGFLVFPDFSEEIMRIAHDTGLVYMKGRKIPLSNSNTMKVPGIDEQSRKDGSRWGGVQMFWQNEADQLQGSKPKYRLIELVMKKLTGLYYATDELIQDAGALGMIVTQAFGEEVGFKMDDAAINGDGSGKPQGILQSNPLIVIAKETGQPSQTVLFQNILKMWFRLYARCRKNAVWFVNQDIEQQLLQMSLSVGTGGSSVVEGVGPYGANFFQPQGWMGNETAMLFGRPVVAIEQAQTLGTQGDIILADMSQWLYADRGDMQQATSMHVRFLTDEMTYRWIYRVDGQSIWHTALTPFNGTNTQSPFLTLAAR